MKRVTPMNNVVVTDVYHQETRTVKDEKGNEKTYEESTTVTIEFQGGKMSLRSVDPKIKLDPNKSGVANIEEELLEVRYKNRFQQEKTCVAWVPVGFVSFAPAR